MNELALRELALFAGAGGGILGGHMLGWRTVCAVEIEAYPRRVLLARQRDGILPRFPIWDDITTFDGRPWKGRVDIISGGFPCQDISAAGKGAGIEGERSGLWGEMARVIDEVRPRFAFVENSPMLTSRGLGTVLGDLAELGYDARWCVLGADDAGAPHRRKRIWILAYTGCENGSQGNTAGMEACTEVRTDGTIHNQPGSQRQTNMANSCRPGLQGSQQPRTLRGERNGTEAHGSATECGCLWWDTDPADGTTESRLGRVSHGVAHRVDRLKAIGNGQVPAVAALAFTILSKGLK